MPNDQGEAAVAAGAAIRTHLGALLAVVARQRREGRAAAARADTRANRRFVPGAIRVSFDSATSNVGSLADEFIRHEDSNNGKRTTWFCRRAGDKENGVATLLRITREASTTK